MNKRKVDDLIPKAYEVLKSSGIVERDENGNATNKINKAWRGQISSFGASIAQGSLIAAVSFFSKKGQADVDRSKLMEAIKQLLELESSLYEYVKDECGRKAKKENIINAAVALKLAMNLYNLE